MKHNNSLNLNLLYEKESKIMNLKFITNLNYVPKPGKLLA